MAQGVHFNLFLKASYAIYCSLLSFCPSFILLNNLYIESSTMNKASEGDGIPADLFKILNDDALKEVYSVCQQIWKVQQQSQDWKS